MPLFGTHDGHATHHQRVPRQAQFLPQACVFAHLRQHHRRMDGGDGFRPRTTIQQLLAHIPADGDDAMRQPGIGIKRIDGLGQMPRTHNQRRTRQPCAQRRQHGVAAAVGVEDVKALAPQQAAHERHATQEIAGAVHHDTVHREPLLAQPVAELRAGLADQFQMVATVAHRDHLLVDAELLPTKRGGSLGMQDAQTGAGVAGRRIKDRWRHQSLGLPGELELFHARSRAKR
ncbi:hypothetical protein D3C73_1037920 [compost metagenome]